MIKIIYNFNDASRNEIIDEGFSAGEVVGNWGTLDEITRQIVTTKGSFNFGVGLPSIPQSMRNSTTSVKDLAVLGFSQQTMMLIIKDGKYLIAPSVLGDINTECHSKEEVGNILKSYIKQFMQDVALRAKGGVTVSYSPTISKLLFVQFSRVQQTP